LIQAVFYLENLSKKLCHTKKDTKNSELTKRIQKVEGNANGQI